MPDELGAFLASAEWSEIVRRIRARTPARLLAGRAGAAVCAELDLETTLAADFVKRWGLFEVCTQATLKDVFLLRPDLGRKFNDASREELQRRCSSGSDFQIAIGDGLSVPAVAAQVPTLLPLLHEGARGRGLA